MRLRLALALLVLPVAASAAGSSVGETTSILSEFARITGERAMNVLQSMSYIRMAYALFIAAAIFKLASAYRAFIFQGVDGLIDALDAILQCFIVVGLMTVYGDLTKVINDAFMGAAQIIAAPLSPTGSSAAPAQDAITGILNELAAFEIPLPNFFTDPAGFVLTFVYNFMVWLIGLAVGGSLLYSFWGYTLLKILGLPFLPTLLTERFKPMFDAWFSMFLSIGLYYVVLTVNAALYLTFYSLFTPAGTPVQSLWTYFAFMLFSVVAVLWFLKSYGIAAQLTTTGGALSNKLYQFTRFLSARSVIKASKSK